MKEVVITTAEVKVAIQASGKRRVTKHARLKLVEQLKVSSWLNNSNRKKMSTQK